MRALVCTHWGTADELMLQPMEESALGPDEVRVEVHAAGLNFPDTLIIEGRYQFRPALPFVPGSEAAGTVIETGSAVTEWKVGDRVISVSIAGSFAERIVRPAKELLPLPPGMSFRVGAGFALAYGTSYYALKQCARLTPGETLLVLGAAGGVGLAAVELGVALGARVIAAASSEEKLDVACRAGASDRINYGGNLERSEIAEKLKQEIKALTGGSGADVVYDPVGGPLSEPALRSTAWNGRFLVVGFASGEIPSIPLNLPLLKNNAIIGVFFGPWIQREPALYRENLRELFDLWATGRLHPLISQIFRIDDYRDAFAALSGRRATGKVVLEMRP